MQKRYVCTNIHCVVCSVWYQKHVDWYTAIGPMSRMNRETLNYVKKLHTHTHTHTVLTNQLQLCVSVCYVEFTLESVWPYGIKRPILTSPPHLSSWDPAGKTQWAARAQQQMCVCERQRECMHARVYYTPSTSQEHKDKTRTLYDPKRRRHVHSRVI